jgi:hypothetical protein
MPVGMEVFDPSFQHLRRRQIVTYEVAARLYRRRNRVMKSDRGLGFIITFFVCIALDSALFGYCGSRIARNIGMAEEPWYLMGYGMAPILFFIPGILALRMRLIRLEAEVRGLTQKAKERGSTPPPERRPAPRVDQRRHERSLTASRSRVARRRT